MANPMTLILPMDVIAFLQAGVSITAGSRDARHVPSMARVLACRVADDGATVHVWLVRSQSEQLLLDCHASGQVAAVFSQPTTHRTLQLKGRFIDAAEAEPSALELIDEHRRLFAEELAQIGFGYGFAGAMVDTLGQPLVVIRFSARELYDQTPGPDAGRRLAGGA